MKMFREDASLPVSLPLSKRIRTAYSKCGRGRGGQHNLYSLEILLGSDFTPYNFLLKPSQTGSQLGGLVISKTCWHSGP